MMNCAKSISFGKVMIQSLVFLLLSIFFTAAANANCPDPKDMYPQKGIKHPRWITDSGWMSDANAQVVKGSKPKLVLVYIVEPPPPVFIPDGMPKPIHTLLCSYSNGQNNNIIFNMREPFSSSSSRITRTDFDDWYNEIPTSENYRMGYFCLFGLENHQKLAKCEFAFDDKVKSNDVENYQSPFGNNP
jgi:hypothetical protein